jgi:hypothetical protein
MAFEQAAMQTLSEQELPSSVLQLAKEINQSQIYLTSLRCKARNYVAKVGAIECSVHINISCEEAFTKGTKWN